MRLAPSTVAWKFGPPKALSAFSSSRSFAGAAASAS
jgi:hypothetical protein